MDRRAHGAAIRPVPASPPSLHGTGRATSLRGEIPPGETRHGRDTVQLWDPKGDLEAFLAQRTGAWSASGNTVVSEERSTLADGRSTASYVVRNFDGALAYFFFTTLGDDYLVLSGSGDLVLLAEIAGTLRGVTADEY